MEMIIKTTKNELRECLDLLEEYDLHETLMDDHVIQHENIGSDQIVTDGPVFVVEDMGITFTEGTYYNVDPDTGEAEPDFCVTLIYDTTQIDDFDYNNYTYFEQDPPLTAIHNYLHFIGSR